jgi:hypothetical protein
MRTGVKVTGFALGIAVLFGAAYLAGGVFGTEAIGRTGHGAAGHSHESSRSGADGGAMADGHEMGGHEMGGQEMGGHAVTGLAVTDQGYRLQRLSPDPVVGAPAELAFQILGPNGRPVTSFVNTHEKPLHLIIARRDLSGFQHLHPARDADGTWRVPVTLRDAGDYRVFSEFAPDGRTDSLVLGTDLTVAGDYRPVPLPAPAVVSVADGYTVRMLGDPARGEVRFVIADAAAPVTDLQPYLAAYGHLVALRVGDLGYLHVHPDGGPGVSPPGPEISFAASLPPTGRYRLFLEFAHRGKVHTAAFTVDTAQAP